MLRLVNAALIVGCLHRTVFADHFTIGADSECPDGISQCVTSDYGSSVLEACEERRNQAKPFA